MRFDYKDTFLISKTTDEELQELEDRFYEEAVRLGIEDPYLLQDYVVSKVYTEIARLNIEAEGMDKKLQVYEDKINEVLKLVKSAQPVGFGTFKICRS